VNKSMLSMVLGIIAIAIAFVVFPIVLDSTGTILSHTGDTMEADSATTGVPNYTEDDSATTGVGELTADIVLTYDLYEAAVGNVESITSTEAGDTPTANSYVEATKTLTVGGLIASATRTLTTTYETESMDVYTGLGSIAKVAPLMVFIGLIAGGGFGLYSGVKGMRG